MNSVLQFTRRQSHNVHLAVALYALFAVLNKFLRRSCCSQLIKSSQADVIYMMSITPSVFEEVENVNSLGGNLDKLQRRFTQASLYS
jgi:hypothetical protein